jgi:hypothetical protein
MAIEFKLASGASLYVKPPSEAEPSNPNHGIRSKASMKPELDEVFVVLTKEEKGLVRAIQRVDQAYKLRLDWERMAEKVGIMVECLKPLSRLPIPDESNEAPQSSIDKPLYSVSLDPIFEASVARLRQARRQD